MIDCLLSTRFGVSVLDFGQSWSSGLAFLALVKSVAPGLVDLSNSLSRDHRDNVREAFMIAQSSLGIPSLLDPEGGSSASCYEHRRFFASKKLNKPRWIYIHQIK